MMVAAPFLGEFGWEVAMWAPWLRWTKKNIHPHTDFVVMCRTGHEALYEDFAQHVVPIELDVMLTDCANAWLRGGGRMIQSSYIALVEPRFTKLRKSQIICPLDMQFSWGSGEAPKLWHGAHHIYGEVTNPRSDKVVIHARHCADKQPERNWSYDKWRDLIAANQGTHFVSVGRSDSAFCPSGSEDMRDISMDKLIDLLADAHVVMGPSSGPLHLANACGTSVLWWSGNKKDVSRYAKDWNPDLLQNEQVDCTWNPPVDMVTQCLKKTKSTPPASAT